MERLSDLDAAGIMEAIAEANPDEPHRKSRATAPETVAGDEAGNSLTQATSGGTC